MKKLNKKGIITLGLLLTGTLMIVKGIMDQEFLTVMNKAVMICLECIGIG